MREDKRKKKKPMRGGLRGEFIRLFLVLGIGMSFATEIAMGKYLHDSYKSNYESTLRGMAEALVETLDLTPNQIKEYAAGKVSDAAYEKTQEELGRVCAQFDEQFGVQSEVKISCRIVYPTPTAAGTEAYWVMDVGEEGTSSKKAGSRVKDYPCGEWQSCYRAYCGKSGDDSSIRDDTVWSFCPIQDGEGKNVAVLGIYEENSGIGQKIVSKALAAGGVILVLFAIQSAILLVFVQTGIVRSILRLAEGVQELSDGKLDVAVPCGRKDEIGEITEGFNRMAAHIGGHIQEMEALNRAYQKFVPPETFQILDRESILKIELGDQAVAELALLVMEPNGAREKLAEFSSKQTFSYINRMFAQMVPPVSDFGGSVWQYEKAAVYAFFGNRPKDALEAAIRAGTDLQGGEEAIAAGIATGPVMVGIAGHEERMSIISISEQTRTVKFLQDIADRYYASILVTKGTAEQIPDFAQSYHARFLGFVRLSAGQLEGVYDVYDADLDSRRRKKQRTRESFDSGITLFTEGKLTEAREAFIDVLRADRGDRAAREYLALCSRGLKEEKYRRQVWFAELGR